MAYGDIVHYCDTPPIIVKNKKNEDIKFNEYFPLLKFEIVWEFLRISKRSSSVFYDWYLSSYIYDDF